MTDLTDEQKAEYFRRSYTAVDGLWFMKVEEKHGFEEALQLDEAVWKVLPKIQARTSSAAGPGGFRDLWNAILRDRIPAGHPRRQARVPAPLGCMSAFERKLITCFPGHPKSFSPELSIINNKELICLIVIGVGVLVMR